MLLSLIWENLGMVDVMSFLNANILEMFEFLINSWILSNYDSVLSWVYIIISNISDRLVSLIKEFI